MRMSSKELQMLIAKNKEMPNHLKNINSFITFEINQMLSFEEKKRL